MIFLIFLLSFVALFLAIFLIYAINSFRWKLITRQDTSLLHEVTSPDSLRPVEIGCLYDNATSINEITSILFYLAYKGYIDIQVLKPKAGLLQGEYLLTLKKSDFSGLREYEKTFLNNLFENSSEVSWNDFENSVKGSMNLAIVTFQLMQELQKMGYYFFSKNYCTQTYEEALQEMLQTFLKNIFKSILNIGLGFSKYSTKKARDIYPKILGFKKYLEISEKERASFHLDPKNNFLHISEYAPYVMALNINTVWGKELSGMKLVSQNQSTTLT